MLLVCPQSCKGKLPQPPEIKDEDQIAPFPIFDFGGEEDSSLSFCLFMIVVSLGTVQYRGR